MDHKVFGVKMQSRHGSLFLPRNTVMDHYFLDLNIKAVMEYYFYHEKQNCYGSFLFLELRSKAFMDHYFEALRRKTNKDILFG